MDSLLSVPAPPPPSVYLALSANDQVRRFINILLHYMTYAQCLPSHAWCQICTAYAVSEQRREKENCNRSLDKRVLEAIFSPSLCIWWLTHCVGRKLSTPTETQTTSWSQTSFMSTVSVSVSASSAGVWLKAAVFIYVERINTNKVGVGWLCRCWCIVWEPIWKRVHTQLVREHLATVAWACWATVDWSRWKEWN